MDDVPATKADVWIPRLSLVLAIVTVLSGVYLQRANAADQLRAKRFEVTFLEKRNSFVEVVRRTNLALGAMEKMNYFVEYSRSPPDSPERKAAYDNYIDQHAELAIECLKMKPFLDSDGRRWVEAELDRLHDDWLKHYTSDEPKEFWWYPRQQKRVLAFGDQLFARLFPVGEPDVPK